MKTILLNGQSIAVENCDMHVAPGGSLIFELSLEAKLMSALLSDLREELAYGLIDLSFIEAQASEVRAEIYLGKAELDEFMDFISKRPEAQGLNFERKREVMEGERVEALTMASRNRLIEVLAQL